MFKASCRKDVYDLKAAQNSVKERAEVLVSFVRDQSPEMTDHLYHQVVSAYDWKGYESEVDDLLELLEARELPDLQEKLEWLQSCFDTSNYNFGPTSDIPGHRIVLLYLLRFSSDTQALAALHQFMRGYKGNNDEECVMAIDSLEGMGTPESKAILAKLKKDESTAQHFEGLEKKKPLQGMSEWEIYLRRYNLIKRQQVREHMRAILQRSGIVD